MRVGFVTANLETGGIERVINNLSNYLIIQGDEVSIIATKNGECSYEVDGRIHKYVLRHDENKSRFFRVVSKIREFRKIVKDERFDVILSFGSYITMYSVIGTLFTPVKLVGSERTDPSKAPEPKILRMLRNLAYRCTDAMVFQTEDAKQYFSRSIQKKGYIISNPIKKDLPVRWTGIRENEIVNFCRLNEQKNLPLLYKAFAEFHKQFGEYRMTIYGEGELKDSLNQLAVQLKIDDCVTIKNFTSDIHKCILKSRMFVSSSNYEGISNSMLESMGIGLTCICTDCPVGGARMFIKSYENGILVPVNNEEKLINAMCYIASHSEAADHMGVLAVEIKDIISVEEIAKKWEMVMRKIL